MGGYLKLSVRIVEGHNLYASLRLILNYHLLSGTTIRGTQIKAKAHHKSSTQPPLLEGKNQQKKTHGPNLPLLGLQQVA
jgi:hypothetical protein